MPSGWPKACPGSPRPAPRFASSWCTRPGVIYDLAPADRPPLADAEHLATRYGKCIAGGATLKAAKSVREAIGPVCRTYFGPVLDGQQQPEPSS